ncbi:hypothetical protein OIO90_000409 [Microbotryomycetes sp. JL221]|nr:hypothetical protein OIO90_000409 [Microbotryomycetes sp. JL221]
MAFQASTSSSVEHYIPSQTQHDAARQTQLSLDALLDAIKTRDPSLVHQTLTNSSSQARAQLDRDTFDSLFVMLCQDRHQLEDENTRNIGSTSGLGAVKRRSHVSKAWNAVKQLRRLALERDWQLTRQQLTTSLAIGIEWEKERHMRRRTGERLGDDIDSPQRETLRRQYLAQLRDEVMLLQRPTYEHEQSDRVLLEQYALALRARPDDDALQHVIDALYQAWNATMPLKPTTRHPMDQEVSEYETSNAASRILRTLFQTARDDQQHDSKALGFLQTMLDYRLLPTPYSLKTILQSWHSDMLNDPDAAYDRARQVLDQACSSSISMSDRHQQLDELYQSRLDQIEREERIQKKPVLSFIRWIGMSNKTPLSSWMSSMSGSVELRQQIEQSSIVIAFNLWMGFYAPQEWHEPASSEALQLLDELIVSACRVSPTTQAQVEHNDALNLALDMSLSFLPTHQLARRAPMLLEATILSNQMNLAKQFYSKVKQRLASVDMTTTTSLSTRTFPWHARHVQSLSKMVLSTTTASMLPNMSRPHDGAVNASFVIELYQDWTATGLQFPQGLWRSLWIALGRHGDVDQLARVVNDFEETGRGRVTNRISDFVLQASASSIPNSQHMGHGRETFLNTLDMLKFFRSRSRWFFSRNQQALSLIGKDNSAGVESSNIALPWLSSSLDHFESPQDVLATRVSLQSYEAILRQLSMTRQDQRNDVTKVFQWAIDDGWEPRTNTFNALLACQVLRIGLNTSDVTDNARAVYDAMTRRNVEPDRVTMSLVIHSLLRLANDDVKRNDQTNETREHEGEESKTYIEAAIRAFNNALDRNLLVRGQQICCLMYSLGSKRSKQWDQAKLIAEQWWQRAVQVEAQLKSLEIQIQSTAKGRLRAQDSITVEEQIDKRTDHFARDVRRAVEALANETKLVEQAQKDILELEQSDLSLSLRSHRSDDVIDPLQFIKHQNKTFALVDELAILKRS